MRGTYQLNHRYAVLATVLIAIILISAFVIFLDDTFKANNRSPFYVGIEFGYGNATDCKALIDKVKDYTNLLVISSTNITQSEASLNETCDYAYAAGMHIMVYFPNSDPIYNNNGGGSYHAYLWAMAAKEKYGSFFIGSYINDEPGGEVLDRALGAVSILPTNYNGAQYSTTPDYKSAATNFVANLNNQMSKSYLFCAKYSGTSVVTADYGLYWFDYQAGFDTVLAEFGWGNNRQMAIALCRGAATAQGKDWGAIICWEDKTDQNGQPGCLESGPALYSDLVLAYTNGAKYAVIFDYAGKDSNQNRDLPNPYPYGILTDEHFTALQNFWQYTQQNPDKHGSVKATTALVLPSFFGFGFRSANDKIWGLDQADTWTYKIWNDTNNLLNQYGGKLDIVYNDTQFQASVAKSYGKLIPWNSGVTTSDFQVVDLTNMLGYSSIQQAINSGATASGDTLLVKAGTNKENVVVSKSIVLQGESKESTKIDAANNGSALVITAPNVTVTGFTLENANSPAALNDSTSAMSIVQILTQLGIDPNYASSLDPQTAQTLLIQAMQGLGVSNYQTLTSKTGMYVLNADNCTLIGNDVKNCTYGILIGSSANTTMRNNALIGNQYSFGVSPLTNSDYIQDVDSSNTANGKPIYYFVGKSGITVPSDAGYVALVNCTDATAENLQLSGNFNGLLVVNSEHSIIKGNTQTDNYEGLNVANSTNNLIQNNIISGNVCNLAGTAALSSDVDSSNMVNGKPIYVWTNQHDKTVPADAGYVALINCSGITVQGLNLSNNDVDIFLQNTTSTKVTQNTLAAMTCGIQIAGGSNINLSNNTITGAHDGILLNLSTNNTLANNVLRENQYSGINLQSTTNTSVLNNMLGGNGQGVILSGSSGNLLKSNTVITCTYGLELDSANTQSYIGPGLQQSTCSQNTIVENNFTQNMYALEINYNVAGNILYHNNFFNNTQLAQTTSYSSTAMNSWDNGSSGNYWSSYNGTDDNHDGIGDQPMYVFQQYLQSYGSAPSTSVFYGAVDQDRFPLMEPYVTANT